MAKTALINLLRAQVRAFGPAPAVLDRFSDDLVGTLHRFHSLRPKMEERLGILYEGIDDREIVSFDREIKKRVHGLYELTKRSKVKGMELLKARINLEALLRFHRDLGGDFQIDDAYLTEVFAKCGDRVVLDDEYEYLVTRVYASDYDWFIVLWDDKIWADRVPSALLAPFRITYEEWRKNREDSDDRDFDVYFEYVEE